MRRCMYCGGPIPEGRSNRGRKPNYCCDDHHERDLRIDRNIRASQRRALKVKR